MHAKHITPIRAKLPAPATPQTSVTLTFGRDNDATVISYALGVTNAPGRYDGFGTLTLYDSGVDDGKDRCRYVLIKTEHEAWHRGRYASGLYSYAPSDALDTREVERRLLEALTSTLQPVDA
jgi:hypothetical protein